MAIRNYHRTKPGPSVGRPLGGITEASLNQLQGALHEGIHRNWDKYQYAKSRGFNAESYAGYLTRMIKMGGLRTLDLKSPALREACRSLYIPNTYKAIESFLTRGQDTIK